MNRFFHGKWIRTIIYPLIFFISWTYVGLDSLVCHAFDYKPDKAAGHHATDVWGGFDAALGNLESILAEMQGNTGITSERWEQFDAQVEQIEALDQRIRQRFDQEAEHLAKASLNNKIKQRQQSHAAQYQQKMDRFFDLVAEMREAQDDSRTLKTAMADLEKLLKERKKKRKARKTFDPNNMPFQNRKLKPKNPRMDKESFERELKKPRADSKTAGEKKHAVLDKMLDLLAPSAEAAPPPPVPEDLAETMEIQFTEDILAKAAELNHDPVKIYNWVRNNVEYVPTWGSIQGAQYCLETLQGNAFDTASLLIALLRASNIPARYVIGTVEVPIDKVMNWVGNFNDAQAAVDYMASGGVPVTAISSSPGNEIQSARIEHVWVEAFVDYSPSRASRHKDGKGDTWVEMDASFKQYDYSQGVNIEAVVPLDVNEIANHIMSTATFNELDGSITGFDSEYLKNQMLEYMANFKTSLTNNLPDATLGELIGSKKQIIIEHEFLLGTLPYKLAIRGGEFAAISNSYRHSFFIEIRTTDIFEDLLLSATFSTPEIAGKKVMLNFTPATENDAAIIQSYMPSEHSDGTPIESDELPDSLPARLINVKAELQVDDVVVSTSLPVGLGTALGLSINLNGAGYNEPVIYNEINSGDYLSIGINLSKISDKTLVEINSVLNGTRNKVENNEIVTKKELLGDLYYATTMLYHHAFDTYKQLLTLYNSVVCTTLPSIAIFGSNSSVDTLFGIPQNFYAEGIYMDADRLIHVVKSTDNDSEKEFNFSMQMGMRSSALEHEIPERIFRGLDSNIFTISAVKAIKLSGDNNIPVYHLNSSNYSSLASKLNLRPDVIGEIQSAINAGKEVIAPESELNVSGWQGCGYIIIDPVTGSGAYMISGGTSGGDTVSDVIKLLLIVGIAITLPLAIFGIVVSGGTALILFPFAGYISAALAGILSYTTMERPVSEFANCILTNIVYDLIFYVLMRVVLCIIMSFIGCIFLLSAISALSTDLGLITCGY